MIWPKAGGGAHQELYYDDGSGFKLAGSRDTPTCGKTKTETTMNPGQQIEFRIDCSNVTYSGTDVQEIVPLSKIVPGLAGAAYVDNSRQSKSRPLRWSELRTHHGTNAPPGFPHTDVGHSC